MSRLPTLVTRPPLDAPAVPEPPAGPFVELDTELADGIPARLGLDGTRSLVLSVPLGSAAAVLAADARAVVVDTRDGARPRPPDQPAATGGELGPRLTLVDGAANGDTAAVVPGVRQRLGLGATALVELRIDVLVLTAGSLRAPGRFGSRLLMRWRFLDVAAPTGPPPVLGDPTIPTRALPRH